MGARVAQRQRLLHVFHGSLGGEAWGLVETLYLEGVTGIFANLRYKYNIDSRDMYLRGLV